jgi:hypothetical protein
MRQFIAVTAVEVADKDDQNDAPNVYARPAIIPVDTIEYVSELQEDDIRGEHEYGGGARTRIDLRADTVFVKETMSVLFRMLVTNQS